MNIYKILIPIVLAMTIVACSTDESADNSVDLPNGAYVRKADFKDGDEISRSNLIFDGSLLRFSWNPNDVLGIYPTYIHTEETSAPTNPSVTESVQFICTADDNSNFSHIEALGETTTNGFNFADGYLRTAYYPFNQSFNPYRYDNPICYDKLPFSYEGQVQGGYVNMTAYYLGDGTNPKGATNPTYIQSEKDACAHLGKYDYLVSPEQDFLNRGEGTWHIRFNMHHLGAVARFFLLAPEENMRLINLRLVASKPIFYKRGWVDLSSTTYDPQANDGNDGLKLVSPLYNEEQRQIYPDDDSKTAMLQLDFAEGVTTKYNASTMKYGNYLLAYMMMYPVDTSVADEVYVYIETETLDGKHTRKTFRTQNLNLVEENKKNMFSGRCYQWTERTMEDDHPIELTATVIPWQDVVGGGISTAE